MLRFRILAGAAAAIGQGRRRLVHLVDERGILTFVVAPLLRVLGIFPCRLLLPPSAFPSPKRRRAASLSRLAEAADEDVFCPMA